MKVTIFKPHIPKRDYPYIAEYEGRVVIFSEPKAGYCITGTVHFSSVWLEDMFMPLTEGQSVTIQNDQTTTK